MNKAELLRQLRRDVFTRLAPSRIHGIGVFAIKRIPRGTNPFRGEPVEYCSIPVSKSEFSGVPKTVRKMVHDLCAFKDGYCWVPNTGIEAATKGWYMNHSTKPNMRVEDDKFVAVRNIRTGEELTVDYRTYTEGPWV